MKYRLLLLALCACALACDSANPVAPTGTVLSISANPSQIALNGQSTITVTGFKPDANRLNPGTQIILSTSLGNLFHPTAGQQISIVEIDGSGQGLAILRGDGRAGSATVNATLSTSGGGGGGGGGDGGSSAPTTGASASVTVQIGQTDDSRPTVVIDANPTIIPTSGVSRINMLGRNSDNSPVGAGQRIRLTADLGTLVRDGGRVGDPVINEVLTDANGEASASFIAGDRAGTGEVSAILGTSEESTVSITIRSALASLDLDANPQTIQRLDAGETIELQVVVNDAQGSPIPSVLIRFDTLGSLSNNPVPTNSQGIAESTLTVRAIDVQAVPMNGTFTIRATGTSEGVELEDTEVITVLGSPN